MGLAARVGVGFAGVGQCFGLLESVAGGWSVSRLGWRLSLLLSRLVTPLVLGMGGLRSPLGGKWGCTPVGSAALGLGFTLRLGVAITLCHLWREPEAAGKEGAVGRGVGGWGGGWGAGSLTLNSLLGDSSSQSLDTSHGNHGPEMSDSLWQADFSAAAGVRVSPCPGPACPLPPSPSPLGSHSLWKSSLRPSLAPSPPCRGSGSIPAATNAPSAGHS